VYIALLQKYFFPNRTSHWLYSIFHINVFCYFLRA
jgi:hypothetical protein